MYLINWEKAKIDIPIYDLYKFYKKYALYFNFKELITLSIATSIDALVVGITFAFLKKKCFLMF